MWHPLRNLVLATFLTVQFGAAVVHRDLLRFHIFKPLIHFRQDSLRGHPPVDFEMLQQTSRLGNVVMLTNVARQRLK